MTENEARKLGVSIEWNGRANVCVHCGKVPETFYVATGHDHTDYDIRWCPCREPNPNWCAGCSPDNCSGCGAAPAAYIFKPNNELLWPNEVDQNVFASDPEDYDLLYTSPQPDRTAELEAALKVARDALIDCEGALDECRGYPITYDTVIETLAKIDEVLK